MKFIPPPAESWIEGRGYKKRVLLTESDLQSSHLRECCEASTEHAMVWRSGTDAGRLVHNWLS